MSINQNTFWAIIGKFAYAGSTICTALATTIEDEVEDAVQQMGGSNALEFESTREGILTGLRSLQSAGSSALTSCVVTPCQQLLIQTVKADNQQPADTLAYSLDELIAQMIAGAESVDASTVAAAVAYGSSNVGTGVIITSIRREDGLVNEYALAEVIGCTVTVAPTTGLATISVKGDPAVGVTAYNWPQGSGCSTSITSHTASSVSNKVGNGTFEETDESASHLPEGWIAPTATLGTTLKMTTVEVQTVAISGTPTGGYYLLHFTDRDGYVQTTAPLVYNASGTAVQTALRALTGLSSVSVSTSGTTPDFTHTITFTDVPNPSQLTSTSGLTGGSGPAVGHATTTAGSAYVMSGARSVELDSDGAELTTIQVPVSLSASTQYAVNVWMIADVVPAAGRIVVDLVDGVGGTVIQDASGLQNTLSAVCTSLSASVWKSLGALAANVNEVQTITQASSPASGNFKLTFNGQQTANIAYNADAATVQAALEALSNVGVGDVACGGGALPGTPVTVTFGGKYASQDVPMMTVDNSGVTGGTFVVTETTPGNKTNAVFRTPATLPPNVYLRIRIHTAISGGTSVYLDEVCLIPMTKLYTGGIYAAAFSGRTYWRLNDTGTITVTNDAAGVLGSWANRIFALRDSELLIPSNVSAQETQADSAVS